MVVYLQILELASSKFFKKQLYFSEILKGQRNRTVVFIFLTVSLGLLPCFSLFADRVYLNNGNLLRGKILRIEAIHYKFEKSSGGVENIPKKQVKKVTFDRGKTERGYDNFFARLLLGAGLSEYGTTVNVKHSGVVKEERELKATYPPVRMGLEVGWMIINYHLALHCGLEYTHSNLLNSEETSYFYQSLTAGLSYYLPFSSFYLDNIYFSAQARMLLSGSAQFKSDYARQIDLPFEGEGTGFGLSIGKEWYSSNGWIVWGMTLTYSRDSLKSQKEELQLLSSLPSSSLLPRSAAATDAEIITEEKIDYIGIAFSVTYD